MPDFPPSRPINQSRRTLTAPTIIAAIFLGLHVLPLFWRPNPLWGVDFLFYLPAPVQGIFILFSILLFIPGFRRQIRVLPGLSYRAMKRGDQARVHFEKTLELEPNHPQAARIRRWLERVCEGR